MLLHPQHYSTSHCLIPALEILTQLRQQNHSRRFRQRTSALLIMPRGNAAQTKVLYQGKEEDFVVFVDTAEDVEKWKADRSIPLAQVVSGFKIMITHK